MLLRDSVYEGVKRAIISGELAPAEQIQEAGIAEQYDTSKTPAREALARLAQDGLLEVLPRVGYVVTTFTIEQAQAVFDFRAIIEAATAELAARYVTEAELQQLDLLCDLSYRAGEPPTYADFFARNRRFHLLIATASRNPYLVETLDRIFDQVDRLLHYRLDLRASTEQLITEHSAIVAALGKHDQDAARTAMLQGLTSTRDQVLGFLMREESADQPVGPPGTR